MTTNVINDGLGIAFEPITIGTTVYKGYKWKKSALKNATKVEVGKHYKLNGKCLEVIAQVGELSFRVVEILEVLEVEGCFSRVKLKFKYCKVTSCCLCDKSLSDSFSILTGVGPVCAKKLSKARDVDTVKKELLNKAEALGTFELWISTVGLNEVTPEFFKLSEGTVVLGMLAEDSQVRKLAQANYTLPA